MKRAILSLLVCLVFSAPIPAMAVQDNDGCFCDGKDPDPPGPSGFFASPCKCGTSICEGSFTILSGGRIGALLPKTGFGRNVREKLLRKGTADVREEIRLPKAVMERLAKQFPNTKFTGGAKIIKPGKYKATETRTGDVMLDFGVAP